MGFVVILRIASFALCFSVFSFHPAGAAGDPTKERLDVKNLPKVTEWLEDTAGKVKARSRKALMEGPDALEALAQTLLKNEMKDRDGRYVTPFFYREITEESDEIAGEPWEVFLNRVFTEWRKKYPESGPAKIASARFHFLEGSRAMKYCTGVADIDRKWEVVRQKEATAMELLNKCREWNRKDPGWAVTFFVIVEKTGIDENKALSILDEAMEVFPDSAYILSRAAFLKFPTPYSAHRDEWEPWLRKHLSKLPPDAAAKLYVNTWTEMIPIRYLATYRQLGTPDEEMMFRGMDLLAKEFPGSPAIATQEAYLSMKLLDDRQRAFNAVRRANGRIDLHTLYGNKKWYSNLLADIASTPWKPATLGIAPIRVHRWGIPMEFIQRIEAAAADGPRGMEELIRKLRVDDRLDRDGKYQTRHFFDWFDQNPESSREEQAFQDKKALIELWMKEIPDSPFAKLAAARLCLNHAWDARSSHYASRVSKVQWHGFRQRLKVARKYLMACRELQETEPEWSSSAFTLLLGEGGGEDEFEEIADVLFERFPDADGAISRATMHFLPKWGGTPGTWEPWLKRHLANLPEDQAAKAYARVMNGRAGFLSAYQENARELLGEGKPDVGLWLKGLDILKKEFPDSTWVVAGEAIVHSHFTEDTDAAQAAFKKMNQTLDYDVWESHDYFYRCSRWVTRTQTQKKK